MTPLDSLWLQAHPLPQPGADTDKNSRGRVLVAGGSETVPGALRLTGEAALRAGAGKVQLATVARAAVPLGMAMPEAAVFPLPAGAQGELAETAGDALAPYLDRCDTLVLGPGMGAEAPAGPILKAVLARPRDTLSLLLDAAALPAAADMAEALHAHDGRVVLTPHPGEMIGLMGCDAARIEDDPEGLAREAAARFRATVLLKGPETWIACPGEDALRYPGGGPGLATGGSGDVLAGVIGGLLARGAAPRVAAGWGVWLHGEAGRRLAERVGPLGFLGRELPPEIPRLMALGR
jgi:ADP-dependent NAD(P)H-hydrate dehydratase